MPPQNTRPVGGRRSDQGIAPYAARVSIPQNFIQTAGADQRSALSFSEASLARSSCMKPRRDAVWMSPPTTRPRYT